jgi:transketolase
VEVTTGPLGQGFANGVGIGLAEANLRERFGPTTIDHHVFVICGDGCLEEGVSHEAASLAGHLGLGRLVYVYDDNHITIDGPTELAYSDNVAERFQGYGWHVIQLGEAANDLDALEAGLRRGMAEAERPSMIILRSHIGWPSPKWTDTNHAHGDPLGDDEVAVVKEILGLPQDAFYSPDEVVAYYREAGSRGRDAREQWERAQRALRDRDPGLADEFDACLAGRGLAGWEAKLPTWNAGGDEVPTRRASGKVLSAIVDVVPGLLAGGADLSGNTGTLLDGVEVINTHVFRGRQLHFGIREHGMGSSMNGMSVSGLVPAGGTFFVFSDYMRAAVRLAALSHYKTAFVWTHDSVGVGEDGPTHQPVEQLMSLRLMPGLRVIRPADANETSQAWRLHIDSTGPTAIVLSRQAVPVLEGTAERSADGLPRGAYVLVDEGDSPPDLVLVGTGSEVSVCVEARETLIGDGRSVRVVSFPSWDLFAAQPREYREAVLPPGVPKLSVEAGVTLGWERYVDDSVGINRFGASAPGPIVLDKLGINPENVVAHARALLEAGESR